MTTENTQLAVRPLATDTLATFIGMEKGFMLDTLRTQCFRTQDKNGNQIEVTDAQVAAFVSIAVEMKVNPLLPGMLYAYPKRGGGIIPIMGPDGVFKKLSEHPDVDGWEVKVCPEDVAQKPTHAVASIFRKGSTHPISYTALISEWYVGDNPNWSARPRHMLQIRALKHAARKVIHGLPYDEDDRIIMEKINVTPGAQTPPERPDPSTVRRGPGRPPKGAAAAAHQEPAKPAEVPAIDVQTTPAADTPAKEPEKAPEKPAEVAGKSSIAKGEKVTVTVKVVSAQYEDFAGSDGAIVVVSGEYNGKLYDLTGGMKHTSGSMPKSVWSAGNTVKADLLGRNSKALGVIAIVEKAEKIVAEEADLP